MQTCSHSHTYKGECVAVEQAHAWWPSVVCQGKSSKCGSILTLMNDLSRQCPTHAQLPLYPREGQPVCVCMLEKGVSGGYLCMCSCLRGCVRSCVYAPPSVYCFGNPRPHMWMAWQRHYTSQRFGIRLWVKWQRARGLNTLTSVQPWGAPHYFNGKIHDPFPVQTLSPYTSTSIVYKTHHRDLLKQTAIYTQHLLNWELE